MDALEAAGVDSLWLPEIVYGSLVDPLVGMAYALARTTKLKVGTGVAILPGRTRSWWPSNWPRWQGWRPSGSCRCSGSARPGR